MAQYIYHIPFFPVFQKMSLSMVGKEHKNLWPGEGYISGTVIAAGSPMPDAVMELYDCSTKQFVKSTTTDILGDYRFDNLDRSRYFDVIAIDPNTFWEKKISSYRRPKHDLRPQFTANDGGMVAIFIDNEPFYEGGFGEEVYIPAIDNEPFYEGGFGEEAYIPAIDTAP